jgi:hypothetical protein
MNTRLRSTRYALRAPGVACERGGHGADVPIFSPRIQCAALQLWTVDSLVQVLREYVDQHARGRGVIRVVDNELDVFWVLAW